jgi:exopolysaccharide production protein ExoZ
VFTSATDALNSSIPTHRLSSINRRRELALQICCSQQHWIELASVARNRQPRAIDSQARLNHDAAMGQPRERLDSIQVLRALAALLVLFAHLWSMLGPFGVQDAVPTFNLGAAGVDLFFAISGFIMVYTSELLFGQPGARATFLVLRISRIVPLYWSLTTAVLFQYHRFIIPPSFSIANVIWSYLFIPSANDNHIPVPILSAGWTLNYEMFFYFVFSLFIFLPRRWAVVIVTLVMIAVRNLPSSLGFPPSAPVQVWTDSIIYEFAFGMWIALAYREGLRVPLRISLVVIAFALALMWHSYAGLFVTVSRTAGWGGGAALILASVVLCVARRPMPVILKPFVLLGDASYALYLFHGFSSQVLMETGAEALIKPVHHPYIYCVAIIAVSIGGAFALTYFFDKYVGRYMKGLLRPGATGRGAFREIQPLLRSPVYRGAARSSPDQ